MYKMVNHLVPQYLSLQVSRPGQQQYNLRNTLNIPEIFGTHELYRQSFLPSTVKEWNKLPQVIRQSTSIDSFKNKLVKMKRPSKPPFYFNSGCRLGQIHHARLRMQNSDLNDHLVKQHISEYPQCAYGVPKEDPEQYLLFCPKYSEERKILTRTIGQIKFPLDSNMIDNLLHSNHTLTGTDNKILFEAVAIFIESTKRFTKR